jgi:dihydroorotase
MEYQLKKSAESHSPVRLFTSACITEGRLGSKVANLEELAAAGAAFFTDDGSYVADDAVMEEAMKRSADLCMVLSQHALDPRIVGGGVIRDCPLVRKAGLEVIPAEAEISAIRRDLSICRETGCRLHIQHISTAQGVSLVRDAQKEGLPVTAEATPHHLLFACDELTVDDANFKMAPPLGNAADRAAIRAAVKDGTLGVFATDHAPHPAASKVGGFIGTANGIIGLEVAVAITYHVMVEQEGMDVNEWAKRWTEGPARLIGEEPDGETVIDLQANREVCESTFRSLSRNMPYMGLKFSAWPLPAGR